MRKLRVIFVLLCLMLMCTGRCAVAEALPSPTPVPCPQDAVLLKKGDTGDLIHPMKQRLYELGYFSSGNFSVKYNDSTEKAVRLFQEYNHLPVTGNQRFFPHLFRQSRAAHPFPVSGPGLFHGRYIRCMAKGQLQTR